jgi:hypothetical protein
MQRATADLFKRVNGAVPITSPRVLGGLSDSALLSPTFAKQESLVSLQLFDTNGVRQEYQRSYSRKPASTSIS